LCNKIHLKIRFLKTLYINTINIIKVTLKYTSFLILRIQIDKYGNN
jgi:hypothetical protein